MKYAVVFVCYFAASMVALCIAAPAASDAAEAKIVKQDSEVLADGYKFAYETSDGSTHNEEGELKNAGTDDEAIAVHGSYSYVGDDGQTYSVSFVADENGFQPEGAHIPHA